MGLFSRIGLTIAIYMGLTVPTDDSFHGTRKELMRFMQEDKTFLNTLWKKTPKVLKHFPLQKENIQLDGESFPRDIVFFYLEKGDTILTRGPTLMYSVYSNRAPGLWKGNGQGLKQMWFFPSHIRDHRPFHYLTNEERNNVTDTYHRTFFLGIVRYNNVSYSMGPYMDTKFHYIGFLGMWKPILVTHIEL